MCTVAVDILPVTQIELGLFGLVSIRERFSYILKHWGTELVAGSCLPMTPDPQTTRLYLNSAASSPKP